MTKHILALMLAVAAAAAAAQPAPQVYRLSPEEVLRLQRESAERAADLGVDPFLRPRDGKVHGEVGIGIGTGGYRSLYGAFGVPLGEDGSASFAFETGQDQIYRRSGRGWGHPAPAR